MLFRTWQRAFIAGIADEGDDDASLDETLRGVDNGGLVTAAAAVAAGGAAPVLNAGAQRRRNTRLRKGYKLLFKHVENESIRSRFETEARNNGELCWNILDAECAAPEDEMVSEQIKAIIQGATILHVCGYIESSVTLFSRYLTHTNGKIQPVNSRLSEHELSVKMLSAISSAAPHLKVAADCELKAGVGARSFVHPAGHPLAGQRSLAAIVAHFDPLWQSQIEGGLIARKAATKTGTGGITTRVDGMAAEPDSLRDEQFSEAFVAQMMNERLCWNCLGAGHIGDQCPSDKRDRSIASMILLLQRIASRNANRSGQQRFGPRQATPTARSVRPRPPNAGSARRVQGFLLDDGTFVHNNDDTSDDGHNAVSSPSPEAAPEAAVSPDGVPTEADAANVELHNDPDEFDVYDADVIGSDD